MNDMPGPHRSGRQLTAGMYAETTDKKQKGQTMSKRKTTKTSRSITAPGGGTTHLAAEWTELDTTEYVYAIRVMTTKGGKPRKYPKYVSYGLAESDWWMEPLRVWVAHLREGYPHCGFRARQGAKNAIEAAEAALGCTCKVVKIAAWEVCDE